MLMTVDRTSAVPTYQQIRDHVVRLVDAGTLAPGDRLPPTRTLARTLGVHRSTVMRAYAELWALGYIESRPGSYSTVRRRARPVSTRRPRGVVPDAGAGPINWNTTVTRVVRLAHKRMRGLVRAPGPKGAIDFERLAADPTLIPLEDIRCCVKNALAHQGRELLDYGDAMGLLPLREAIARRLRVHGVDVSSDEILITGGAQQGLDLVLRMTARPGDGVAIESPTYSMAISLLRLHDVTLREIPMRPDGMDLDVLETVLARRQAKLVYTIPNFHNPTGITTDQAHRERLLAICEAHGVPIVEDGFEEEMKYFGMAVLPIKSMDARGIVIYIGTFSKVVFPGLRIGWIAAPRGAIERLSAIQRITSLSGNGLGQAAAARFCGWGQYEAHLRRIHKVYRKRMQGMLQGLREQMPRGIEWTQPAGGYTLWLRAPGVREDETALHARILRDGVRVAPGSHFFVRTPAVPHFRLSIAVVTEEQIVEGCRRLGRSLAASMRG